MRRHCGALAAKGCSLGMRSTGPAAGGGYTVSLPLRFERDVQFGWPMARRRRPDHQPVRKALQVEISLRGPHMETCTF